MTLHIHPPHPPTDRAALTERLSRLERRIAQLEDRATTLRSEISGAERSDAEVDFAALSAHRRTLAATTKQLADARMRALGVRAELAELAERSA